MPHHEVQWLREKGFRITRQRKLILDVVRRQNCHLSADEIYRIVAQQHPTIDRATVYRTLNWLHDMGLVRTLDGGSDRQLFEYATTHPHHHLICKQCGVEVEIDNHVIECLQAHIREHYDFDADPEHVAIFGRCAKCRHAPDPLE